VLAGGAGLIDRGVHAIATARFVLGKPEPVQLTASIGTADGTDDGDDPGGVPLNRALSAGVWRGRTRSGALSHLRIRPLLESQSFNDEGHLLSAAESYAASTMRKAMRPTSADARGVSPEAQQCKKSAICARYIGGEQCS
jgi:predicted dehydrogenase